MRFKLLGVDIEKAIADGSYRFPPSINSDELFINTERAIAIYHLETNIVSSGRFDKYSTTILLHINERILVATYSVTTTSPREDYPDIVKSTARKWIDAILSENKTIG
jgi:hypothetical protein